MGLEQCNSPGKNSASVVPGIFGLWACQSSVLDVQTVAQHCLRLMVVTELLGATHFQYSKGSFEGPAHGKMRIVCGEC